LSPEFCATVFADNIGRAHHLVVAPNGVVYVNTWSGGYYSDDTPPDGGFLVALQDTHGGGNVDVVKRLAMAPRKARRAARAALPSTTSTRKSSPVVGIYIQASAGSERDTV
jgi:hypothetical protein